MWDVAQGRLRVDPVPLLPVPLPLLPVLSTVVTDVCTVDGDAFLAR